GAPADVVPGTDGLSLPARPAHVSGGSPDHAGPVPRVPVLCGGAPPGMGAVAGGGPAVRGTPDVGAGDTVVLGRDDGGLVPVGGPGRNGGRRTGRPPGCLRDHPPHHSPSAVSPNG